jgi:MFS family permease
MVIVTLGEMLFLPTMSSITAQLSPPEQRGRYMGLLGFSQALASSLAPMLGGVLLDTFPNTPLFSWGIFACMALAASMGFLLWNKAYRGYQSRKFNNSIVK